MKALVILHNVPMVRIFVALDLAELRLLEDDDLNNEAGILAENQLTMSLPH